MNRASIHATRQPDFYKDPFSVFIYDSLESTNTFLKTHQAAFPAYSVVWAKSQTKGRGRFERPWRSEAGKDLCFSIVLPLQNIPANRQLNITHVTALAVCRVLQTRGVHPAIKWPNDVLVSGKKICGILCETVKHNDADSIVVGVGVNINSSRNTLSAIDQPATSLLAETGRAVNLREMLEELLDEIFRFFMLFKAEGFAGIREQIKALLAYKDKRVYLSTPGDTHQGKINGITPEGALLFHCEQCGPITAFSGEVSLKNT